MHEQYGILKKFYEMTKKSLKISNDFIRYRKIYNIIEQSSLFSDIPALPDCCCIVYNLQNLCDRKQAVNDSAAARVVLISYEMRRDFK